LIAFRGRRAEVGWNLLLVLSLGGILVASWFAFVMPKPHPPGRNDDSVAAKGIEIESRGIAAKAVESQDRVKERTWNLTAEVFGSRMLDSLTRLAEQNHIRLASFNFGKPIAAANLQEAPFSATVDGGFLDVMAFVSALEEPDSKLALNQIRIASSGGDDKVSATLAMTGFLSREEK
jgi:hypothetical protein